MTPLDWLIVILYLGGMILMSFWLGRGQESQEDYFVGGRDLPWWAVGLSTMATQSSATSFISIPAFVALKPDGGLKYLQWELAVPLSMIFIMIFLIPFFRKLNLISVYEYLEKRFGSKTRTFLASVFLVSRGLGTGVGLYAVSIVIAVILSIQPLQAILLIGVITLIYDTIGGMKAVVYSDVIQMIVLMAGIAICSYYSFQIGGGVEGLVAALSGSSLSTGSGFDPSRLKAFDIGHTGLGDGSNYNFWAMTLGGFFLYASYYGCDQSQTQRELSAPTLADTKYSLIFNGLARFPLIIMYVAMGVLLAAAYTSSPGFQELMSGYIDQSRFDYLLPVFILNFVPDGLRAIIFAAILAAAMSSLDSSLNSLSASTMQDFVERYTGLSGSRKYFLIMSKVTTVLWGVFAIIAASGLHFLRSSDTVVEVINMVGSIFYGPILATFIMGVAVACVSGPAIITGVVCGVGFNLYLALFCPDISWLYWNAFGFIVAALVSYLSSLTIFRTTNRPDDSLILWNSGVLAGQKKWIPWYLVLLTYFLFIVFFSLTVSSWLIGFCR